MLFKIEKFIEKILFYSQKIDKQKILSKSKTLLIFTIKALYLFKKVAKNCLKINKIKIIIIF